MSKDCIATPFCISQQLHSREDKVVKLFTVSVQMSYSLLGDDVSLCFIKGRMVFIPKAMFNLFDVKAFSS